LLKRRWIPAFAEMTSAQRLSIADVTLASFRTRPEALFNASDVIAE